MALEPFHRPGVKVREIVASVSGTHVTNASIAFLFSASAPVAITIGAGVKGGLTQADIASWIFASFFLNGALSIVLSLLYRMPLAFFWTIPGTVLVGAALDHLSFPEVIGAFYVTAAVLFILGITGSVRRFMAMLPMPIIMAMVAGVFLKFGLDWVKALHEDVWIALPMTAAFFILASFPILEKRMPPMIGVLIVGIIVVAISGRGPAISQTDNISSGWIALPIVYAPVFSLRALIELVIPLTITVVAAQNAQGIAILQTNGHKAPVNTITTACGVVSAISAVFGCVSSCLAGPSNAVLCSGGERSKQYVSGLLLAILAMVFGLFSPLFTGLMVATPPAFIATLAGLALLKVLQGAFQSAFQDRFTLGASVAFIVTIANQSIFNIGAPFWGLVFGLAASWLLERSHFAGHAK